MYIYYGFYCSISIGKCKEFLQCCGPRLQMPFDPRIKGTASKKMTQLSYCRFAPNFIITFTNMHVLCLINLLFLRN